MTRYTCPEQGCNVVIEGHDNIHEVLEHEKTHFKKKNVVKKTEEVKCEHCGGKGTITQEFLVEEDVPEAD